MSYFLVLSDGQEAFPIPDPNPIINLAELPLSEPVEWFNDEMIDTFSEKSPHTKDKVVKPASNLNNDQEVPDGNIKQADTNGGTIFNKAESSRLPHEAEVSHYLKSINGSNLADESKGSV